MLLLLRLLLVRIGMGVGMGLKGKMSKQQIFVSIELLMKRMWRKIYIFYVPKRNE